MLRRTTSLGHIQYLLII